MNDTTKQVMLAAPESQLCPSIKDMIREKWDDEPKAIQILEVLDAIVYNGAASDFVVSTLDFILQERIEYEKTTYGRLVERATWRTATM